MRWRLVPRLPARVAALVPMESVASAAALLGDLRAGLPSLEAVEFFLPEGLDLVVEHLDDVSGPPVPQRAPIYLLIECAATEDPTPELAEALGAAGLDEVAAVADDTASRERLWRVREGHAEAIAAAGVPHKLDVGVPLARLGEFLERVPGVVQEAAPGARTILFGHLGDGNVHVNLLGPAPDDEAPDDAVLGLVLELGGTISAEHGVGVAKAAWLARQRPAPELAAITAIKRALDPEATLNPGAVLLLS